MAKLNIAAINTDDMTLEQLKAVVAKLRDTAPTGPRRVIAINSSGGLFIRDPKCVAVSKNGKEYVAGTNLPWEVARVLFGDAELLAEVQAYVKAMATDQDAYDKAQMAALTKKLEREEKQAA